MFELNKRLINYFFVKYFINEHKSPARTIGEKRKESEVKSKENGEWASLSLLRSIL